MRQSSPILSLVVLLLLGSNSHAQFGVEWIEFSQDDSLLSSAQPISDVDNETSLAWGDLDQNGRTDLVVVRGQPFGGPGKRRNVLLMNLGGVLTDQTVPLAIQSDVPGDNGFFTPTSDRDVVIVDVDNDGWLDVVTATTVTDPTDPKQIAYPRVYINLGDDGSGSWLGLRHEDARIPALVQFETGQAENPRFYAVAAADVNADGYADLYFGDADPGFPFAEPATEDLDDRLLINDGNGFFVDGSQLSLSPAALSSSFADSVCIADFNQDGAPDIVKQTGLFAPIHVAVTYNNPLSPGLFTTTQAVNESSPYYVSSGDLNQDGRLDLVVTNDATDRYRINTGTDGFGLTTWSSSRSFDFLSGGDDGFGGDNRVADIDGDGWNDVLITDVSTQIASYSRRLHIYHNRGGVLPGAVDLDLVEEREQFGSGGWVGAVGLTENDLKGTHDVAVFDVDGDGRNDLVVSRKDGTQVWLNVPTTCQEDLGFGAGFATLEVCGGDLSTGSDAVMRLEAQPNSLAILFAGTTSNPTFVPEIPGTLMPLPALVVTNVFTNSSGQLEVTVPGGGGPFSIYAQFVTQVGVSGLAPSNAVRLDFLP